MKKDLIQKIQSKGYWRINFQPLIVTTKLKTLGDCCKIVEDNHGGKVEMVSKYMQGTQMKLRLPIAIG